MQNPVPEDVHWSDTFGGDVGFTGSINSMTIGDGDLFVGGNFGSVDGKVVNNVARWTGDEWQPLETGLPVFPVTDIEYHQGVLYAGSAYSDFPLRMWDGERWDTLSGWGGQIIDLQSHENELYAVATFELVPGTTRNGVWRWNEGQWEPLGDLNDPPRKVTIFNNIPYVLTYGATENVLTWDGKSWNHVSGLTNVQVKDIVVCQDAIYLATNLATYETQLYRYDGEEWSELPLLPDRTERLTSDETHVFVQRQNAPIVEWDGEGWREVDAGFRPHITSMVARDGKLFVAGYEQHYGMATVLSRVGVFDGETWKMKYGPNGGTDGIVRAIAKVNHQVIVGGDFQYAGNLYSPGLARWTGAQWTAIPMDGEWQVVALAVRGTDVYVAGLHRPVLGTWAPKIARWDGVNWHDLAHSISMGDQKPGRLRTLALDGETLYLGGSFAEIDGVPAVNVAAWNGQTWSALGEGLGPAQHQTVTDLSIHDGYVFACNEYAVYQWNGSTWDRMGNYPGQVKTIYHWNDTLYVAGTSSNLRRLARWNSQTWESSGPWIDGSPYEVLPAGDQLFLGGYIEQHLGAYTTYGVISVEADGVHPLGNGLTTNLYYGGFSGHTFGVAYALQQDENYLYVGGDFVGAGLKSSNFFAAWSLTPTTAIEPSNESAETIPLFDPPFPNPAASTVHFSMTLASPSWIRLELFDLLGRCVAVPYEGHTGAGRRQVDFSTQDLPAGAYLVRLTVDQKTYVQPLMVSR